MINFILGFFFGETVALVITYFIIKDMIKKGLFK